MVIIINDNYHILALFVCSSSLFCRVDFGKSESQMPPTIENPADYVFSILDSRGHLIFKFLKIELSKLTNRKLIHDQIFF